MSIVKTNETKRSMCRQIVDAIRDAMCSNSVPQTIGLSADGIVASWYNIYGLKGCEIAVYDTEE